jgi:hypothetical protein
MTLDSQALSVEFAAAVAMTKILRIAVLNRCIVHKLPPCINMFAGKDSIKKPAFKRAF